MTLDWKRNKFQQLPKLTEDINKSKSAAVFLEGYSAGVKEGCLSDGD